MLVDYVGTYITPDGVDFNRLINADFFQPVSIPPQPGHLYPIRSEPDDRDGFQSTLILKRNHLTERGPRYAWNKNVD
jgi:hypothetical protein